MSRRAVSRAMVILLASAVARCSATTPPSANATGAHPPAGEAVTVFLNYFGLEGRAVEGELVGCIRDGIRRAHPELRVVPPDDFRRLAFPDLPPDAAPRSPQYLGMLLDNSAFRERIAPLNLHYLIAIGGETRVKQTGGVIAGVAPAPGGGFLLGGWVWNRDTRLVASILDLKATGEPAEMRTTAQGTAWLVLIEGLPLGAPALTESRACAALGDKVARYLVEPRPER